MVIYLKNPQGGTKVACSEMEAQYDESKGWVRYQVGTLLTPDKVTVNPDEFIPVPESIDELRLRYWQQLGKKPHHKKGAETLRRELGL